MTQSGTDSSSYKMIHTMIRVKDPWKSMKFYQCLGLKQINQLNITEDGFNLYYMAYDKPESPSCGRHWTDRSGVLELTHYYGTENDPDCQYSSGNETPHLGYGHIAIFVDDLEAVNEQLQAANFTSLDVSSSADKNNERFLTDPDGYQVKLEHRIPSKKEKSPTFSYTMLRVRDPVASLKFYKEVLGMTLLRTVEQADSDYTEFYVGYTNGRLLNELEVTDLIACGEGLVKLVWIHGTELDVSKAYHNGNTEPRGFGHLCVSVDDLDAACERFESMNLTWPKRLNDTAMHDMAFMTDPDGYWIELLQNEVLLPRAGW